MPAALLSRLAIGYGANLRLMNGLSPKRHTSRCDMSLVDRSSRYPDLFLCRRSFLRDQAYLDAREYSVEDRERSGNLRVGNAILYQLSYFHITGRPIPPQVAVVMTLRKRRDTIPRPPA